jgi:hypothetical protein
MIEFADGLDRRTRAKGKAKGNETSLPSHNCALMIRFRTKARRDGLFDRSVRPLEDSDAKEVGLGFIGAPPSASYAKAPRSRAEGSR